MFYQDPALFGSQSVVDRCVDDIAHTFNTTRTALNVTAVAKGLIAGAGTFCRRDGSTIRCDADRDGILVPALKELLSVNLSGVKWILVIEKEATFRSIAGSAFWETTAAEGMILTGKGYPDLATRALLRFLSEPSARNGFASPVIFGLADFDPDGLAILSTYKHGSKALAHESSGHSVPQLRWLGLKSSLLPHEDQRSVGTQGVLKLTKRDRSKARGMLEQHVPSDIVLDLSWQSELRHMLMLNVKAELQMLDATPDGMTKLLNSALCCPG
jgi:meiotic recombination protein SPO11